MATYVALSRATSFDDWTVFAMAPTRTEAAQRALTAFKSAFPDDQDQQYYLRTTLTTEGYETARRYWPWLQAIRAYEAEEANR